MTKITVIKPFAWTNAIDPRDVVHRVVSLANVMRLCTAHCGLEGKWSHVKDVLKYLPAVVMTSTTEPVNCMACLVREASYEMSEGEL